MMETIDLGIKFMRGYEPAPTPEPVPGGGTDVAGSLAQTGDLNIALIFGLVMLAFAIAGVVAYAFVNKKQFAGIVSGVFKNNKQLVGIFHEVTNSFKSLKLTNISLRTRIISAVVAIFTIVCIICGCFAMNAHAANEQSPLVPDKNTITAIVAEDGTFTLDTCILTNTDVDKYTVEKSVVAIAQESSEIEGLEESEITVEGFDGTLYDGKPGTDFTPQDLLDLEAGDSTTISFSISLPEDFDIETLFDKQVFNFTITPKIVIPHHDNLYQYSLEDLQTVSRYLVKNYTEDSTDPVCVKFRAFRDNGLTTGGTDNGVAMNDSLTNHWAIDKEGRLFEETGFINNAATIQARIIGICEDKDASDKTIGLTFMTTHALRMPYVYEEDEWKYAKYGWAGSNVDGKCTLQSSFNSETANLFPSDLFFAVKSAKKGYQYSNDDQEEPLGNSIALNKFWAPSMAELYGTDLNDDKRWPNNDTSEGKQYTVFSKKLITSSSYGYFTNIDILQDASVHLINVWSRSLNGGYCRNACCVDGYNGGEPSYNDVSSAKGAVACFCI